MRNYIFGVLVMGFFIALCISTSYAEKKAEDPPSHKLLDTATKDKLLILNEAPEEMQKLSGLVGIWNFDLQYWDEKDSEPQLSNGVATNEFIFGDKFISGQTSVILNMNGENIHYENRNIIGYDAHKKQFTSVYMDVFNSNIVNSTIEYDDKLEAFKENGSFVNLLTGKEEPYRGELKFLGGEGYMRSYFIKNAKDQEYKVLEITYSRPK